MKETSDTFRKRVMEYYRVHGRHDLPWRNLPDGRQGHVDPYAILVSEVMLQQTQVDRVVLFFDPWLQRFPTVKSLAQAPLSAVLKEWQGLGYNRRAKLLRKCAKEIIEKHGGNIPRDYASLVALSAIGPYAAGAIRAFAFDEPDVFIETNIRAALIHHFFPRAKKVSDTTLMPILKKLCKLNLHNKNMKKVLGQISPREWYSALMDYGAYIKKTKPNPSRRSKHHAKQSSFEGSLRQIRGALIRRLIKGPITKKSLLNVEVKDAYRIETALRALEAEGMIEKKGKQWQLAKG